MIYTITYSIEAPETVKPIARAFKNKIKDMIPLPQRIKLTKAKKGKSSDFDLVFSPVVSRTGTDIDAALSKTEGNKPVVLVVLHHTFDTEAVVSKSSQFVETKNVQLTVDCLFYEDKGLLDCNKNDEAYKETAEWLVLNKKKLSKKKKTQASSHSKKSSGKLQEAETDSSHKLGRSPTDGPSNAEEHSNN